MMQIRGLRKATPHSQDIFLLSFSHIPIYWHNEGDEWRSRGSLQVQVIKTIRSTHSCHVIVVYSRRQIRQWELKLDHLLTTTRQRYWYKVSCLAMLNVSVSRISKRIQVIAFRLLSFGSLFSPTAFPELKRVPLLHASATTSTVRAF